MHDGMLYDPIQGQGHDCLKATQEESTVTGLIFQYFFLFLFPCDRLSLPAVCFLRYAEHLSCCIIWASYWLACLDFIYMANTDVWYLVFLWDEFIHCVKLMTSFARILCVSHGQGWRFCGELAWPCDSVDCGSGLSTTWSCSQADAQSGRHLREVRYRL